MKEKEKAKRKVVIATKLTEEEARKVREIAEAKGITVSDFVRSRLLNLPIPDRISPERLAKKLEEFRKLLYEVNKIGVNINQIARYCNKYREVDCEVLAQLIEIRRELKALVQTAYEGLTSDNRQAGREELPERES